MKLQHTLLAGLLAGLIGTAAHAAITAEQAKALGTTLTGVGAYTKVILHNSTTMLVSKKLKLFEDILLHRPNFARPHRSYILNLNFLKKYARGESLLIMDNGTSIPVAREKKQEFEAMLKDLRIAM